MTIFLWLEKFAIETIKMYSLNIINIIFTQLGLFFVSFNANKIE